MSSQKLGSGESKLETAIGLLLIIGVIACLGLEIAGMVVYYHAYGQLAISQDQSVFIRGQNFFSFIYNQFRAGQVESQAIQLIIAGIIVLMLTPYVRVIVSVLYFARAKNARYVLITLFVLVVLTVSLVWH